MKKILILGGTGFVGRHVCEKLDPLQWHVTVPTRRQDRAQHLLLHPLLDVVVMDVNDAQALTRLMAGHDVVLNLVAQLHGDEASFNHLHVALPQKIAQACQAAGVSRLLHVSALGVNPQRPEAAPSMYLRSKGQGEAVLQQAQDLALTLFRPSVMFGAEDKFLNRFASLQRLLPFVPLAGADTRFQPVWVEDVAQALVHCLHDNASVGQTYELCGPDVLTLKQLVQLSGRLSGVRQGKGRPVISLPLTLGKFQAGLLELAPGEPLMSRDNLDSMQVDNVASGKLPGLDALGIHPGSVEGIAPSYLGNGLASDHLRDLRQIAGRR